MAASPANLPTVFDSLAALSKFVLIDRVDPEFYKAYFHGINMATSFMRVLAGTHAALAKSFQESLAQPLPVAAQTIRSGFESASLRETEVQWIDAQMTASMRALIPVLRAPNLPSLFGECKWAIEGAFE